VAAGHDVSGSIRKYRADGDSAFLHTLAGFKQRGLYPFLLSHLISPLLLIARLENASENILRYEPYSRER